ncbi:MAG: hypothetical protein ACI90V_010290, partial [Bacillariaceae sp.]
FFSRLSFVTLKQQQQQQSSAINCWKIVIYF